MAKAKITAARYAAGQHVTVSRQMLERGAIVGALHALGLERESDACVRGLATPN